jgi:hypothetical protein
VTFADLFAPSLNIMDLKWMFAQLHGATYDIWANQIKKKPICIFCHKEEHASKSCMVCLQIIEELARVTICDMDLLDDITFL